MTALSNLDVQVDTAGGVYSVRLTGTLDTSLLGVVGLKTMDVGAFSQVASGGGGAEIALVLDNTGSMATEGRMVALKAAAKSLVDTVMGSKGANGYLKIGIVPFSDYVNVGLSNRNASWMNVPADWTDPAKTVCETSYPNATASNCHAAQGVQNIDGVVTPYTYQVCDWVYGNPVTTCSTQAYQHRWHGCVGSRNSPLDLGVGNSQATYPGIMDPSCTMPVTPLTDNQATLDTALDAMQPEGETYIAAGVLWGWNLLDPDAPYTEAKSYSQMNASHGSKVMVIMTDGENTRSPVYPYHYGSNSVQADSITSKLCDGAKQAGITVYTVGFKVQAQSSKDLLLSCASDPSKAFDAADNAALQASFDSIAKQFAMLHLSR
jgi:Mg-chelatase subunit ChlD